MGNELEVLWSPQAELSYLKILSYIIDEWSVKDADNFDKKTERLIAKLRTNQNLCPKSNIENLRKCLVSHQTSLVYRVENNCIEIVDFISNYSLHGY
jgi:plasmid stabilization system protein ParE